MSDDPRLVAAIQSVHLNLMATGAVTLDIAERHAPGLAEGMLAVIDAVDPARRALQELRRLHFSYGLGAHRYCNACEESWPCATVEILDGAQ